MTCRELEQFLYPYIDGEFGAEEKADFEAHLAGCPECTAKLHQEAHFVHAVRSAAQRPASTAPEALRAKLQNGFRGEVRREKRAVWLKMSAAAAVAIIASGSLLSYQRSNTQRRFLSEAALRHAKGHPLEITRLPHEGVEAWFGGKLDHHVRVPRLPNVQLTGARISNVENKPAAYIRYELPAREGKIPRPIGLFVIDDRSGEVSAGTLREVAVGSSNGYNVALWRDGEIVYELVSDLDEADIRRMLMEPHTGGGSPAPGATGRPNLPIQPAGYQQ